MPTAVQLDAFRLEVSTWISANLPPSLRASHAATDGASTAHDTELWASRVAVKGWGVPTWPTDVGGAGLTPAHEAIIWDELRRAGATNPINSMGTRMFGPTLLQFGTPEQKARHLPGIANGTVRWCQGFSEPGAGSDLASLQTKCEDAGDHWRINGQKVWTSGGLEADWCFCLVRTDPALRRDGISFVLIPMRQPGVEVRPIRLISGASPFCETFFTDARAEKDDMVGPLNGGWAIGKRLLQFERANQAAGRAGAQGIDLVALARTYVGVDDAGRIADPDLRSRLVQLAIRRKAHALTLARAGRDGKGGLDTSSATSVLKNSGTAIAQAIAELAVEILGHQGLGWEGSGYEEAELGAVRGWLDGKAFTILGGSHEIQHNIIAKRILGLPER